uniref:Uncharacterized protein n=1 Tax=Anguilla anguilla TaxID=7936 RepID=A0A0E9TDJ9_ANGAN
MIACTTELSTTEVNRQLYENCHSEY